MSVHYRNPAGLHAPVDNMYSHVTVASGTVFCRIGGQVPVDEHGASVGAGDMEIQLRCCYEMVDRALRSEGLGWKNVIHLYTFTTQMDSYLAAEQAVARDFFGQTPPPSTLVEVTRLVDRDWLVEVQADAIG